MVLIIRTIYNPQTVDLELFVPGYDTDHQEVIVPPGQTLDLFTVVTGDMLEAMQKELNPMVQAGLIMVIDTVDTATFNPVGGGGGSAAGLSQQIQYNLNGNFGASPNFIYQDGLLSPVLLTANTLLISGTGSTPASILLSQEVDVNGQIDNGLTFSDTAGDFLGQLQADGQTGDVSLYAGTMSGQTWISDVTGNTITFAGGLGNRTSGMAPADVLYQGLVYNTSVNPILTLSIVSVDDITHLTVSSISGLHVGDVLYQYVTEQIRTTITFIVDATHIMVQTTYGLVPTQQTTITSVTNNTQIVVADPTGFTVGNSLDFTLQQQFLNGNINLGPWQIQPNGFMYSPFAQGAIGFQDASTNQVILQSPASVTSYRLFWPAAQATAPGQVLSNDGLGHLSWVEGTTAPGGVSGNIQYNLSGEFAGATGISTDGTHLGIGTASPATFLEVDASTGTSNDGIRATFGGSWIDVLGNAGEGAAGFKTVDGFLDLSEVAIGGFGGGNQALTTQATSSGTSIQSWRTHAGTDVTAVDSLGNISTIGNVGIVQTLFAPTDPSAVLDIQSTTKGFLPPRMTTAQRNNISPAATGTISIFTWAALSGSATVTINGITLTEGVDWVDQPFWTNNIATPLASRSNWSIKSVILGNGYSSPVGIVDNTTLADSLPNFSISFWVQLNDNGSNWVIGKNANPSGGGFGPPPTPGWDIRFVNGTAYFEVVQDGSNFFQVQSGINIADGAWHNVIMTYDSTTLIIYVDGTMAGSGTATGTVTNYSSPEPLTFNLSANGTNTLGQFFDECRLFSTVLSPLDAIDIASGSNPTGATAIAYWTIEEGTGVILHDSIGANTIVFGSNNFTANAIMGAINANVTLDSLLFVNVVGGVVNIAAQAFGPSGNSIPLAISDNVNMAISGPTLSGGGATALPPGLTIYNLDSNTMNYWNATSWVSF